MRSLLFTIVIIASAIAATAQEADNLIKAGIVLHDKNDLEGAITKYDAALKLEPDNYVAMYEKSLSLMNLKRHDDAEDLLKTILKKCKDPDYRRLSYVNYGTLLDYKGERKKSVKLYEQGIKEFPDSYLLYFNKGVTEAGMNEMADAIESFQHSVQRNPYHASSHNGLGRLVSGDNRISAILSLVSFLLIEPTGKRAEENLVLLNKFMNHGVTRTGEKSTTITLDPSFLDKKKSKKDDDFSSTEFLLSLMAASNEIPDSLGAKTEGNRLSFRLQMLINAISDKADEKGFAKSFYVPFLAEMKKNELVTIAAHIMLSSTKDQVVTDWLKENKDDVDGFYRWFENYKWNTK